MQIKTPSKINPYLRLRSRREDGYHEVEMTLVPISIYDELEFRVSTAGGISLVVEAPEPLGAPEDNLVYRAAAAFQARAGLSFALQIHLRKRIPAGAGLGGGSGNAAGTLLALNAMHDHPLQSAELDELALQLGADVPFFLNPVPSHATGLGERLSPLPAFPRLALVVVKPSLSISTHAAYEGVRSFSTNRAVPPLATLPQVLGVMENQFEASLFKAHPHLAEVKRRLLEAGAAGALLAGSGAAIFGVFADDAARDDAAARLAGDSSWQVFSCETLPHHSYLPHA